MRPFLQREGAIRYWGYVLITCAFAQLAVVIYAAAFWIPLSWDEWLWCIGASGLISFFALCAALELWDGVKAERQAMLDREP